MEASNRQREERKARLDDGLPAIGAQAPSFALPLLGNENTIIRLSDLRGRPVILVFGSYSCGRFERNLSKVRRLYEVYKDVISFFLVYTREVHPNRPSKHRPTMSQSLTMEDRGENASACVLDRRIEMPILLDLLDDEVATAYGGLPNRLYLLDGESRVIFRSEGGPQGSNVGDLEAAIDEKLPLMLANADESSG